MYLLFIQLALATYIILFILQSLSGSIFDKLMYSRFVKMIDDKYKAWVKANPEDEWISAKTTTAKKLNLIYQSDSDSDNYSEEDKELILGDASTIITSNRLKDIFGIVWSDNASTFQVTYKTIMLIVYVKMMINWGHTNELIIGVLIGGLYHLLDLCLRISGKVQSKFFAKDGNVSIENILTNPDKISYKTLLLIPVFIIFGFTFTKANIYTRILGEWVMNMSTIYLYCGQILGYVLVQTFFNLIKTAKTNPMIVLLTLVYIMVSLFI